MRTRSIFKFPDMLASRNYVPAMRVPGTWYRYYLVLFIRSMIRTRTRYGTVV